MRAAIIGSKDHAKEAVAALEDLGLSEIAVLDGMLRHGVPNRFDILVCRPSSTSKTAQAKVREKKKKGRHVIFSDSVSSTREAVIAVLRDQGLYDEDAGTLKKKEKKGDTPEEEKKPMNVRDKVRRVISVGGLFCPKLLEVKGVNKSVDLFSSMGLIRGGSPRVHLANALNLLTDVTAGTIRKAATEVAAQDGLSTQNLWTISSRNRPIPVPVYSKKKLAASTLEILAGEMDAQLEQPPGEPVLGPKKDAKRRAAQEKKVAGAERPETMKGKHHTASCPKGRKAIPNADGDIEWVWRVHRDGKHFAYFRLTEEAMKAKLARLEADMKEVDDELPPEMGDMALRAGDDPDVGATPAPSAPARKPKSIKVPDPVKTKHIAGYPRADRTPDEGEDGLRWQWRFRVRGQGGPFVDHGQYTLAEAKDKILELEDAFVRENQPEPVPTPAPTPAPEPTPSPVAEDQEGYDGELRAVAEMAKDFAKKYNVTDLTLHIDASGAVSVDATRLAPVKTSIEF